MPSLVFGVAIGNLLQGVPFRIDNDMRVFYEGSGLSELLNPFGLLCGLVSLAMLVIAWRDLSGGQDRRPGEGARRRCVRIGGPLVTVVLFILAGVWVAFGVKGYAITSAMAVDGPSNPLLKTVAQAPGSGSPIIEPSVDDRWRRCSASSAALCSRCLLTRAARRGLAFVTSAVGIFGVISTAGVSMFPFLMPSRHRCRRRASRCGTPRRAS